MRFAFLSSLVVCASLGCATLGAQAPVNLFEIFSGCTNFTSRGNVQAGAGEYLLEVPASHFSGVGHDASGSGTRLSGFRYVTQDENASTQETYYLVVRGQSGAAPDCSAAGLLLRAGPYATPPSTVVTPVAWQITTSLATASLTLPLCGTFYTGMEFPATGWPNDGQSVHITDFPTGDNPAPGTPSLTWNCIAGAPVQPQYYESLHFGLLVEAAVLNLANVDPTLATTCLTALGNRSFGAGGLWPACNGAVGPRNDGLDCRVRDLANANGVFALFIGVNAGCPGFALGSLANGALYLNPVGAFLQIASGNLDPTGQGYATIVPPNTPACASVANRYADFQAVTVGPTFTLPVNLTNRASTNYRR